MPRLVLEYDERDIVDAEAFLNLLKSIRQSAKPQYIAGHLCVVNSMRIEQ